jgi:hypothetical protein
LRNIDRLILVWLSRLFPSVVDAIVIVKPEAVVPRQNLILGDRWLEVW